MCGVRRRPAALEYPARIPEIYLEKSATMRNPIINCCNLSLTHRQFICMPFNLLRVFQAEISSIAETVEIFKAILPSKKPLSIFFVGLLTSQFFQSSLPTNFEALLQEQFKLFSAKKATPTKPVKANQSINQIAKLLGNLQQTAGRLSSPNFLENRLLQELLQKLFRHAFHQYDLRGLLMLSRGDLQNDANNLTPNRIITAF